MEEVLSKKVVQNFLFQYVDNKMSCEKMPIVVGKAVEEFLNTLDKPLQLNEMRVMREPNYVSFHTDSHKLTE